jgi:hypothetical protein
MDTQLLLLAFALLVVLAIPASWWLVRRREVKRLRAAANAHAEREIAQEARWRARKADLASHRRAAV